MRIKILSDNTYEPMYPDSPVIGTTYLLEDDSEGTGKQNRFFHKLVMLYFNSGCFSDNADTADELKQEIKKRIGIGYINYMYDVSEDIPKWVKGTSENEKYNKQFLASWSDYTKKERKETITNLIQEMITTGVEHKDFESMIQESVNLFK